LQQARAVVQHGHVMAALDRGVALGAAQTIAHCSSQLAARARAHGLAHLRACLSHGGERPGAARAQCVTAVDPEWLAELGPMFFSIKESHSSRLAARARERAAKASMGAEMAAAEQKAAASAAEAAAAAAAVRERQRSAIATPGASTPLATPRRAKFGL